MAEILRLTVLKHGYSSKYLKSDYNIIYFSHQITRDINIGQLNISSIRNKFKLLSFLIGDKVDLLISEKKKY